MTKDHFKKALQNNWLALSILFFTWLIFFSRTLSTKFVYYLDDLKIIYFPLEWSYAQFQSNGTLPLWSNFFGIGHPLLAWGQLGFFTPLHLLLRALSIQPLTLLQISIITYFAFGSLGMYLFLRRQNISPLSSSLGAILFTYSGFHIGHLSHVNFYTTTLLLPWLLLLLHNLITKPSLISSILVTVLGASMALSGQPQIVLYSFLIAATWFIIIFVKSKSRIRVSLFIILSGLLAFSLASFSILPLLEFLPTTERAYGLSTSELLEFSYPPHHAITLVLPYFFGDRNYYWGAKSYQELAAFIGIIPLLLIGAIPIYTRKHRALVIFGLILLVTGIVFSLGRHSPIYLWFVTSGFIKSIAIPGRFVFLFIVGSSVLAAVSLDNIIQASIKRKLTALALSLTLVSLLFYPFFLYLQSNPDKFNRFISLFQLTSIQPILILLGILAFISVILIPQRIAKNLRLTYLLVILSSLTLITYGWQYNPLTAKDVAYKTSPLTSILEDYNQNNKFPPRIYQVEHPSISARRRTESISPSLTIFQPVISQNDTLSCFTIPYRLTESQKTGNEIKISLTYNLFEDPVRTTSIQPNQLSGSKLEFCFDPIPTTPKEKLFLSFASIDDSGIRLTYQPTENKNLQAYFFRVANPTNAQIIKSQKPLSILYSEHNSTTTNQEVQKLSRHLNVTANASSLNWIGALAISSFQNFTSSLLADDADPTHYDSEKLIKDQRSIIDLVGITHIIETALVDSDYEYLSSLGFQHKTNVNYNNTSIRVHTNPNAYPKAWLGTQAVFAPVRNEATEAMRHNFNPQELIYISGPTPPEQPSSLSKEILQGSVNITKYDPTAIDIDVSTNQLSWLIVTDSTTPQWQTYIDGELAPQYTAFTVFKAAQVPAGQHKVSFRFESPATNLAYKLTNSALLILLTLTVFAVSNRSKPAHTHIA